VLQIPTPPPTNVDAAAADATIAANASAITTFSGGMQVAVIGLKLTGATILNIVAGNCRGSSAAQKAAHANKKGSGVSASSTPLLWHKRPRTQTTKKGSGVSASSTSLSSLGFSQLVQLIKLRLWPLAQLVELKLQPGCSTCRA
jgi:hypothetical protein